MVDYQNFFLSKPKKVDFDIYVYFHISFAEKNFSLVICFGEMKSLLTKSPNIS